MKSCAARYTALVLFAAAAVCGLAPHVASAADAPTQDCCAYPTLPAHARSLGEFVPQGWAIEAQARGVLDEGRHPAVAFILHANGTARLPAMLPRILAVALQTPDGSLDLVVQNHTLLPRLSEDDARWRSYTLGERDSVPARPQAPPLDFHRGALRVRLFEDDDRGPLASHDQTFAFRLKGGTFLLIGYDDSFITGHLGAGGWSIDFLTRKATLTTGDSCAGRAEDVQHCRWRAHPETLKPAPLLSIEDVGDALDFRPQDLFPWNG